MLKPLLFLIFRRFNLFIKGVQVSTKERKNPGKNIDEFIYLILGSLLFRMTYQVKCLNFERLIIEFVQRRPTIYTLVLIVGEQWMQDCQRNISALIEFRTPDVLFKAFYSELYY